MSLDLLLMHDEASVVQTAEAMFDVVSVRPLGTSRLFLVQ